MFVLIFIIVKSARCTMSIELKTKNVWVCFRLPRKKIFFNSNVTEPSFSMPEFQPDGIAWLGMDDAVMTACDELDCKTSR